MTVVHESVSHTRVERLLKWFRAGAVFIILAGVLAALLTGTPYWIDRSGKVLVATSILATYLQFRYESAMQEQSNRAMHYASHVVARKGMTLAEGEREAYKAVEAFRNHVEHVRRKVLLHALIAAFAGELVSAFGGVLFAAAKDSF